MLESHSFHIRVADAVVSSEFGEKPPTGEYEVYGQIAKSVGAFRALEWLQKHGYKVVQTTGE